jgi:predicted amidohydrolase
MKQVVALGQMDVAVGQPERNAERVRTLAAQAHERGAQLLLLPELWSSGYDLERTAQYASPLDQGPFALMSLLAEKHSLHVYGSSLALLEPGRHGNTAVLVSPSGGSILGNYSKVHLFRLLDEHRHLCAGERPVVVETPWGRTGLAICYDLRFPELFRACALAGAVMVLLCAQWPKPRLMHWQTLLRARAIENQMFIIACNRVGQSGPSSFFGHSCVIDPWGEVLLELGEEETLATAEIDLERVAEVRRRIPVFADRHPEVYERSAAPQEPGR